MQNKLIGLFITLILVGCQANKTPNEDSIVQQTSVTNQTEVVQPDNKYSSILFHPDDYDKSTYREPDFFTSFTDRMQGAGDLPPIPFELFIDEYVNVIAKVRIEENDGGFDAHKRWPQGDSLLSTIWTSSKAVVVDIFYGNEKIGNTVELLQVGGIYDNTLHDYTGYFEELETGKDYLVFIMDIHNHPFTYPTENDHKINSYFIFSPYDGYYKLEDEKTSISKHMAYSSHFKSNIELSAIIPYIKEQMSFIQRSN